jgi:Cu-processing system permease protein
VVLIVPLVSLMLGVLSLSLERGAAEVVFALPVSRWTILLGRMLGLFVALALAQSFGFGLAGLLVYTQSGPEGVGDFIIVLGASFLATAVFLAIAALLSADAFGRRRTKALALALVAWLVGEVFIDLAALGLATFLPSGAASRVLILASLMNPIGALRTGALLLVEGTGAFGAASLALLRFTHGPAGATALIALSLVTWIVVPALWAGRRLERADI